MLEFTGIGHDSLSRFLLFRTSYFEALLICLNIMKELCYVSLVHAQQKSVQNTKSSIEYFISRYTCCITSQEMKGQPMYMWQLWSPLGRLYYGSVQDWVKTRINGSMLSEIRFTTHLTKLF